MLALLAAPLAQSFQTDTTISVSQGTRLRVETQGGDIVVRTWDRNQVRVRASHSRRSQVAIRLAGAVLSLEGRSSFGIGGMVDYDLTVPTWMPLKLGGMYASVNVEGSRAPIEVETLEGDITVKGGAETVKLGSVQGRISLSGARGRVELNSVSEDLEVSDVQGDLLVEGVSGNIYLRGIDARTVDVQTVSGELYFDGRVADGGRYALITHSGEIYFAVAEGTNASISTAIGSGEVRASFPLPASDRASRRRQTFRLGSGSATVDLETFSGDIHLLRPAELATRIERITLQRLEREAERERQRRRPPRPPEWEELGLHKSHGKEGVTP
jgi:DUF4097 and DUF4098 domain-containing protein YvlB